MRRFIFLGLFLSAMGLSGELESYGPQDLTGLYRTTGWSHYQNGEFKLAAWGYHQVMTAQLKKGEHLHDVKIRFQRVAENEYRGNGTITVRYGNNLGCQHRVGARMWVKEGQLFLRENTPQGIPFNPYGPCTAAGPYVWFDHPNAYVKQ